MAGNAKKKLTYSGVYDPEKQPAGPDAPDPYLPAPDLAQAVNLAILLERRPLLLKGEPGSGKTKLAEAVAHELGLPFTFWPIKSTSRARDGLYTYDAVRRLYDAQLARSDAEADRRVADPANYVRYGPLGQAFLSPKRAVVLIDEIDKADIDFANDLLLELDEQRFYIEETDTWVEAAQPPIVFITSNDEKELPDAFLRRCLFRYIEFPAEERLVEIVQAHYPDAQEDLAAAAVNRFVQLRREMAEKKADKNVSTGELLDWFAVLMAHYDNGAILEEMKERLVFTEVLLKSWGDQRQFGGG